MSELETDYTNAIELIENGYDVSANGGFKRYCEIYPFSNENLIASLKDFNFESKDVLTVLGSSDQALDMYLRGAKTITGFDINTLTKYLFYLKKAAICSNIDKKEFIKFFYPYSTFDTINKKSLNYKTFCKIIPFLYGDSLLFWTKIFDYYTPQKISNGILSIDVNSMESLKDSINYLNGNNYYELQEKIKDMEIKFINTDIKDLPNKINKKYNYIYLSNIMQHMAKIYSTKYHSQLLEYKSLILRLSNNLSDDGKMMVCYFFNHTPHKIAKNVYKEKEFNYKSFYEIESGDKILEYTKN